MKIVRCLQFNRDKLGRGRKSCCTLGSMPSPFSLLLSLVPLSIKEIGLKVEQISVIFISQLGEGWLGPGHSSFYGFFPSFCFPTTFRASFYALCIFWGQLCGLICMINFIPMFIPIIRWTEHPLPDSALLTGKCQAMDGQQESEKASPISVVINPVTGEWPQHLHPRRHTDTHKHTHTRARLLLIIILCRCSLMSLSVLMYSAEHTDMAQFPYGCLLTQHTSHNTLVLHTDTH